MGAAASLTCQNSSCGLHSACLSLTSHPFLGRFEDVRTPLLPSLQSPPPPLWGLGLFGLLLVGGSLVSLARWAALANPPLCPAEHQPFSLVAWLVSVTWPV